jgi:hypothetical protein
LLGSKKSAKLWEGSNNDEMTALGVFAKIYAADIDVEVVLTCSLDLFAAEGVGVWVDFVVSSKDNMFLSKNWRMPRKNWAYG